MKIFALATLTTATALLSHAGVITNNFTLNNGGFTASSTGGSNWVYVPGSYWKTGADATNYAFDTRTQLASPTFTASGGSINVSFTHFTNAEATFDGGVLAYSVNGGAATYVPNAAFTANGYQANTVDGGVQTFLGVSNASNSLFSGTFLSVTSAANIGTFSSGDQVQVLFRFASDPSVVALGWRITDFTVNGVNAPASGIPEPATISLIGAGAVLLLLRRRK